jgi:hypothetical protein
MHWRKHDQTPDHHCFHFFNYWGLQNFCPPPPPPLPQDWKTIGNSLAKPCQDKRVSDIFLSANLVRFVEGWIVINLVPTSVGRLSEMETHNQRFSKICNIGSQKNQFWFMTTVLKNLTTDLIYKPQFSKMWQPILTYNHSLKRIWELNKCPSTKLLINYFSYQWFCENHWFFEFFWIKLELEILGLWKFRRKKKNRTNCSLIL